MALTKEQVLQAALELAPSDREVLAEELLLSLSEQDAEAIDAAWLAEIERREAALAAGQAKTKPINEVLDRLSRRSAT